MSAIPRAFRGSSLLAWWLGLVVLAAPSHVRAQNGSEEHPDECCFTNQRYAGVCTVQPAADQACSDVLAILNSPFSGRRRFCGATQIRQFWIQVDCGLQGPGLFVDPRPLTSTAPPAAALAATDPSVVLLARTPARQPVDPATVELVVLRPGALVGSLIVLDLD